MSKKTTAAGSKPAKAKKSAGRTQWLDAKSQSPLIDDYARQTESFLKAMADGVVEEDEVKKQETRLVALMKKIEPRLDDDLHAQMTQLLCELTVYDMMQVMLTVQKSRPAHRFRG
jgi:hypothetical protein